MKRVTETIRSTLVLSAAFCLGVVSQTLAGDWPQYRFNAQRSAATPDGLPADMELLWERELPPPHPAFPHEVRLRFDRSYEPVVLGRTMFLPSMVTDTLTAIDTRTGEERWVYFTDAPIRFAPAAGNGRVYLASDDGFLHCLNADDGTLLWKFRGAPDVAEGQRGRDEEGQEERLILGSGRLISLWPARGGPVLEGNVVYFAAGIWPQDGVFVHAVDAATGEAVWSNTTSDQIEQANVDHGINQYAGITPQGYLARVHDQLVVPCGAQLPAFLDPETGTLGPYTTGWGGRVALPKGTWFVAGGGKYLSHGGDLYDLTRPADDEEDGSDIRKYMTPEMRKRMYAGEFTRLLIDPTNQRELGDFIQPVITDEAMYYNHIESGITAFDLTEVERVERAKIDPPKYRSKDLYPDKWKGVMKAHWNLSSDLHVHIKAGDRLYAGKKNLVQAIDIPRGNGEAALSWKAKIKGTPHSMLAADERLFVTTREGRLYAFGASTGAEAPKTFALPTPQPAQRDEASELASQMLETTNVRDGYALVLGIDDGRLVEELLEHSELQVIAVAADADRVQALRERLHASGLYGTRATVHLGDPLDYPFPPFLANLVVSEDPAQLGEWWTPNAAQALFHPVRPYGGTVCLPVADENARTVTAALKQSGLPGSTVHREGEFVLLIRDGALPEAAAWSHEGGDAANASASQDRFVKAPLEMLWFDSSFRWFRKPGSALVRVAGGRVFVKTDELNATDAFTGRHLWTTTLPDEFADGSVQMVAVEDGVYLAHGSDPCLVFDPATGEQSGRIEIPDGLSGDWQNLRVSGDILIATIGPDLITLNRQTGEVAWKFTCGRPNLSVAVGEGKVFCSELLDRRRDGNVDAKEAGTRLRAFDLASGETAWEIPCGHEIHYAGQLDWVLTARDVFDASDGQRVRDSAASPKVAGTNLVSGSKDNFTLFNLASAETAGSELKWNRRGCTDLRVSPNLVTTRFKANAAYIDLETLEITPIWNIRPGCGNANNLIPADGLLNVPNVTGGCECNYTPVSKAFVPREAWSR
jgi:outer membrane protein assembly factor BamB